MSTIKLPKNQKSNSKRWFPLSSEKVEVGLLLRIFFVDPPSLFGHMLFHNDCILIYQKRRKILHLRSIIDSINDSIPGLEISGTVVFVVELFLGHQVIMHFPTNFSDRTDNPEHVEQLHQPETGILALILVRLLTPTRWTSLLEILLLSRLGWAVSGIYLNLVCLLG